MEIYPGSPLLPGDGYHLDGYDDDLLDVIYEIAMASLDQVISLSQADFLA